MNANEKNELLAARIHSRTGIELSWRDAETLRRCQMTLHRWHELECGVGNDYASWSIERDEATDYPYLVTYPHTGKSSRQRIADKERGAVKRLESLRQFTGLYYYVQSDPRGCALYVSQDPINDTNYTNGVACSI